MKVVEEIFFSEADLINPNTGEKALSLDKFVTLSINRGLFREKACNLFLATPTHEGVTSLEELKEKAKEVEEIIKRRFIKSGKYLAKTRKTVKALFKHIQDTTTAFSHPNCTNRIFI